MKKEEKRFRTQYDDLDKNRYETVNNDPSLALPDLTFTIQELSQRFQINQLMLYNANARALFDIKDLASISDDDFDRPSVNLPKNFDLVDSYNATKKYVEFRTQLKDNLKKLRDRRYATGTSENVAGNTESPQNS